MASLVIEEINSSAEANGDEAIIGRYCESSRVKLFVNQMHCRFFTKSIGMEDQKY